LAPDASTRRCQSTKHSAPIVNAQNTPSATGLRLACTARLRAHAAAPTARPRATLTAAAAPAPRGVTWEPRWSRSPMSPIAADNIWAGLDGGSDELFVLADSDDSRCEIG
jgi:hypothetical protein